MADTVKKAKAPAKPRKAAVKADKVAKTPAPVMPSREEIEKLERDLPGLETLQLQLLGETVAKRSKKV